MAEQYVTWDNPFTTREVPEDETTTADYVKGLAAGTVSIGSMLGGAAQNLGDLTGSEALSEFGRTGRELSNTVSDRIIGSMNESAQRAVGSSFLPGEGDISAYDDLGNALGLKITMALPSVVASIFGGALLRPVVGALAGMSTTAGVLSAGELTNSIYSEIDGKSDEELRAMSPMYDAYRLGGMDEKEALQAFRTDVAGYSPAVLGLFSGLTSRFGVEGAVARIMGGGAKAGIVGGAARGYLGEGFQEGSEGFLGSYLQGDAAEFGDYGENDPTKNFERALEGFLIGGPLGAPFGAAEGAVARRREQAAPQVAPPTVQEAPPAGPDITQAAVIAAQPVPPKPPVTETPGVGPKGRKVKSSKKVTEAAPPVQEVPVGGLSAEEQAAAVTAQDTQIVPPSPQMQAQQLAQELAAVQTQQAQAPVQQPLPSSPAESDLVRYLVQRQQEAQQLAQELPQVPKAQAPQVSPPTSQPLLTIPYDTLTFDNATNKTVASSGQSPVINFSGRMIVVRNVNGVPVPFYLSTGAGGKTDVPSGKWYPFFGVGSDGWINKTGGSEMANYYGSQALREAAESLDNEIGDIRNDGSVPKVKATGAHIDFINQGLSPTENQAADTVSRVRSNIDNLLARLDRSQAAPVPEQTQTIDAQREQLISGERKAVLYTPNQPVPPVAQGMKRIKVKDQIWDYNPAQITAKDIRAAVKAKRENEILDLGSVAKQDMPVDAPEVAVVARDNMGVETRAAVGTPDTAPQQLAEMQATQKSNEAQIAIEPADQVIGERLQNPPKAAKAKAASKARTPVKAPEIAVVPTGEVKVGPAGKKILEVESAVAKAKREAEEAAQRAKADENDADMAHGNRDPGKEQQSLADKNARQRFVTRVNTQMKKGDKAPQWAKDADALRKKFGPLLGRGKELPPGYLEGMQKAHDAEVATKATQAPEQKELNKKDAAKQATAARREAEANASAEERIEKIRTKIQNNKKLNSRDKALLYAVLDNKNQTPDERATTAQITLSSILEDKATQAGVDKASRGSRSVGGDRGLSEGARVSEDEVDDATVAEAEAEEREFGGEVEGDGEFSTDERGTDIQEVSDREGAFAETDPDDVGLGFSDKELDEWDARYTKAIKDNEDISTVGMRMATDLVDAAESLEETYQAPITRERPTVELAEGEGFTAVTETKPVNKVDNPLAQLKPKVSGKISLNKTVKPIAITGERSNLRGNQRQSFSTPSGQVFTPLQTTNVGTMLDRLNFDHLNGLSRILAPKLRRALRQVTANVPLHIIDETQMRAVDPTNPRGFYLHSGHVFIRADQLAQDGAAYAIMHEAVHAAYLHAMRSDPAIAEMVERMRQVTMDHHFGGLQAFAQERYYGMENADEFLAEAMSNPDFQDLLARTPMPEDMARELGFGQGSRLSLWNGLVNMIREFLGLGNSDRMMLEGIMRIGQQLEGIAANANSNIDVTSTEISSLRAEDLTSEVKTQTKVLGNTLQNIAIKGMTLDFMRQRYGSLFNGALDRYVESVQERDDIVNRIADIHDKDAAEFIELANRNPDEAVAMADLAMDATSLDVNLGPNADNSHLGKKSKKGIQARTRIADLQARYNALQPETQALMQKMTGHYRDTHNANVTALAYNALAELDLKVSNSTLLQLLDKVTSGTLTDEDAKLVGDPTIFNALRRSTELKTIKGMYFPNMRFGDHVVLTREKVTAPDIRKVELRGGKSAKVRTELVGDNTVRFIGNPDTRGVTAALMRLADDFVAKSDLSLVAYRKRSMDRTTGEVVSAIEERADREYDVVFEVELQNKGVHFFDSVADAERFRASSKSEKTSQVLDRRADQVQQMISSSALSNVSRAIEARKDIPETRRKQMRAVLEAAIVANLPGNRAEARYQARRNVKGASKDVGRAALAYGRAAGNFQATLQTAPAQREALRSMTEIEDATKFGENAATISKVMNEIRAREATIEGPLQQNKFFQDVATLSFFDKLVSPAYNIVNFQQVFMNTLPVLAGRYGLWRTNSAVMSAYKRIGTLETILSGVKNTAAAAAQWNRTSIDTTDLLGSIRKNLGPKYEPLMDFFIKRGAISPDIGLEIGAALSEGRGAWGQGLSKFDRIARQLPGAVEAVNRMVSAVATYDLAIANGKSHQAAIQEAFDVTLNTQGDYRRSNSPRFMNDGKLAWALQFKKFAVLQTQLMGDMFYRAMKDASPEERAIARKQLATMVAVQVMYAGALGLPGLELAKLVFTMGAALGLSDGWDDQERRVKQILADSIGKTPAELLTSGVISRAIGIDVSKRMSQADLWTGFAPKSYDARGLTEYVGTAILGAPGATVFSWFDASKELAKGDVLKTLELAVPVKTFADTATAVRKYQEGKYSPTDVALKVIGFTSARQARISEETGNRIKDRKKAKAEQDELVKSYLNARSAADRVKAKSKIREFNKDVPEGGRKISINGLDRILEEQRQIYETQ